MIFNAISTLGLSRRMQSTLTGLQIAQARVNDELASGKHVDVAGHLGARTGQTINLRQLHQQTNEYLNTASLLGGRMTLMDEALTGMNKVASELLALAAPALSEPTQTAVVVRVQARGALEHMVGLLNASAGGRYLFSGIEVDTAPMRQLDADDGSGRPAPMTIVRNAITATLGGDSVPATQAQMEAIVDVFDALFEQRDPSVAPPPPLSHGFEGGIYQGATALKPGGDPMPRVTGRPDSGIEMSYGIQANDPAMRDLLQGMFMLASFDVTTMPREAYRPYMAAAVAKLSSGLEGLRQTQAVLGVQQATIAEIEEHHSARLAVFNRQINALEDVDPFETRVRLSQIEAQLEATMSVTARVSRLRLTNYL